MIAMNDTYTEEQVQQAKIAAIAKLESLNTEGLHVQQQTQASLVSEVNTIADAMNRAIASGDNMATKKGFLKFSVRHVELEQKSEETYANTLEKAPKTLSDEEKFAPKINPNQSVYDARARQEAMLAFAEGLGVNRDEILDEVASKSKPKMARG